VAAADGDRRLGFAFIPQSYTMPNREKPGRFTARLRAHGRRPGGGVPRR